MAKPGSNFLRLVFCCAALPVGMSGVSAAEHEFRYKSPDAKSVELMSDFNGWKPVPMTKGNDGVWSAKISLPAGTHAYKFLVNGSDWMFDPENSTRKTVNGVENSAAEVTEGAPSNVSSTVVPGS